MDEKDVTTGPLDAESNSAAANTSGTPGVPQNGTLRGEHSAKQNVVAEDASNKAQGAPIGATNMGAAGLPAAPIAVPPTAPVPAPAPIQTPAPAPASTPTPTPTPKTATGNDIAKILEEVKLPERRDSKSAGDVKPPKQTEISPLLADATPTAEQATQPVIAAEASAIPKPESNALVSMHTLRDDLKQVVRKDKVSYVRAAALESEKRKDEPEEVAPPQSTSRLRGILFAVGLLSLLGLAALGGVYIAVEQQSSPLPQQKSDSLVFAEQSATLPLGNTDSRALKSELAQVRNSSHASLGSITRIVPTAADTSSDGTATARLATLPEFFASIGAQPPADLLRALSGTFFLGIHTVDKNAPVFVIPVVSYDLAFAGMLSWETQMNSDLSPLFMPLSTLTIGADGIPTQRSFSDVVMRNYDVRALKDDSGNIVLYYSFPTRNILIIAESPYTFAEILTRLQAARSL